MSREGAKGKPSKGRELERRSTQGNEETAGELICETNCEGTHCWLGGQLWLQLLNLTLALSSSGLPPEMNSWLVEMDIVHNSQVEELLRTGQGSVPSSILAPLLTP